MNSCELTEGDRDKLVRFLVRRGASRPDAEDIVQRAMFKAWHKRHQYRGDSKWGTWLGAIAKNEFLMWVRRVQPAILPLTAANEMESHAVSSYDQINREEQTRTLRSNLAALPCADRQIVQLVYFQDKTVKEAARALGLTRAAAKTRCWRAINRLRRMHGSSLVKRAPLSRSAYGR